MRLHINVDKHNTVLPLVLHNVTDPQMKTACKLRMIKG